MRQLWFRKLRVAFYVATALVIIQLIRYSLRSGDIESFEEVARLNQELNNVNRREEKEQHVGLGGRDSDIKNDYYENNALLFPVEQIKEEEKGYIMHQDDEKYIKLQESRNKELHKIENIAQKNGDETRYDDIVNSDEPKSNSLESTPFKFPDDIIESERIYKESTETEPNQQRYDNSNKQAKGIETIGSNEFDNNGQRILPNQKNIEDNAQIIEDDVGDGRNEIFTLRNFRENELPYEIIEKDTSKPVTILSSLKDKDVLASVSVKPGKLVDTISDPIYKPVWDSIDSRPIPKWYEEAKFGIFVHWGLYSVPSFGSEKFWWKWKGPEKDRTVIEFMKENYPAYFTYANFTQHFKAEFYSPAKWANLFEASGARYVVLTSKHHDGYTMWPSQRSRGWNSVDTPPHRDVVGDLMKAIQSHANMKFGVYYSLFEWFNSLYLQDVQNNFTTSEYVTNKVWPELKDLVSTYKPDILWSDGDEGPDTYWRSTDFLAWLYNESEVKDTIVTNDRWGSGTACKHGGFLLCSNKLQVGKLRKWEQCSPLDRLSWGYRRNVLLKDLMTIEEIITKLVRTVCNGGNFLLNLGPTKDGMIDPKFQELLHMIGMWLRTNGNAIYSTLPWKTTTDSLNSDVSYTYKNGTIYAFITTQPINNTLVLGSPTSTSRSEVNILGWKSAPLSWGNITPGSPVGVKVLVPNECWLTKQCRWVVTLELRNFK